MGIEGTEALWRAESGGAELWNITIGELLDRQAAAIPEREALV